LGKGLVGNGVMEWRCLELVRGSVHGVESAGAAEDTRAWREKGAVHNATKWQLETRAAVFFAIEHRFGAACLHHQMHSFRACPKLGPQFFLI
jgi:hypothetical protein